MFPEGNEVGYRVERSLCALDMESFWLRDKDRILAVIFTAWITSGDNIIINLLLHFFVIHSTSSPCQPATIPDGQESIRLDPP
jgi:hypothetical protein